LHLPINPPVLPMLAKLAGALPEGVGWIFEPKWDGFRALVFRDGDDLFIQSRDAKPLARYYPELIEPLKAGLPERCVLDGEIVIVRPEGLDFEALQLRLHPAASRIKLLSAEIPASFVFFDLLAVGDRDPQRDPFRRASHSARDHPRAGQAAYPSDAVDPRPHGCRRLVQTVRRRRL